MVGDMNEAYQTVHVDDRLEVFTEIHFWEKPFAHEAAAYHMMTSFQLQVEVTVTVLLPTGRIYLGPGTKPSLGI